MDKEIKLQGKWFLPQKKDEDFGGTFFYTRMEGCYLEIIGGFTNFFDGFRTNRRYNIILGTTVSGKEITLINCIRTYQQSNINGITISKYEADFAILGQHYYTIEDIVFNQLSASIADFENWIGIFGFKDLKVIPAEQLTSLVYQRPENRSFVITDNLSVSIEFESTTPISRHISKAVINQRTLFTIRLSEVVSLDVILKYFFTFYKFLSIAYNDSPNVLNVYLKNTATEGTNDKTKPIIELLYSDYYFKKSYKRGKEHYGFLFNYSDIEYNFPSIVKWWYELYQKVEPAIDILNELLIKREYDYTLKFLLSVQAIETFHRSIFNGLLMPEQDFKKQLDIIKESVPQQYRKWLMDELQFSNQYKLRKRMKELFNNIPDEIGNELVKDKKGFINKVVLTRNYLTHYDKFIKDNIMDGIEMFTATEKLKVMLLCLILKELQFCKEEIIEIIRLDKFRL